MAISDKTRKILWQRSGHRCAICRCELTMAGDAITGAIVGHEFLIAQESAVGSDALQRAEPSREQNDSEDLLLLCPVHHTEISQYPKIYPPQRLRDIKSLHETWLRSTLQIDLKASDRKPFMLYRIQTAKYLISMFHDSHASVLNHDGLEPGYETDLVNKFFRLVQDHINLWDQLNNRDQIQAETELDKAIWELETNGFLVYGCQRQEPHQMADVFMEDWYMAYLLIVRQSNPITAKYDATVEQRMGIKTPIASPFTSFILVQPNS